MSAENSGVEFGAKRPVAHGLQDVLQYVRSTSGGETFQSSDSTVPYKRQASKDEEDAYSPNAAWEETAQLEKHLQVLADHDFFQGIRLGAISAFARSSTQHTFPNTPGFAVLNENSTAANGDGIGKSEWSSSLFVITRGEIWVEENGVRLGRLQAGAVFGECVSFGYLEHQPFTIKVAEGPVQALVIQKSMVQLALRQFPDARCALEERMDQQMRSLLQDRIANINFFSHCGPKFFAHIYSSMQVQYVRDSADILAAKEDAKSMLIIARGGCQVWLPKQGKKASWKRNAVLLRGDAVGSEQQSTVTEASLLQPAPEGLPMPPKGPALLECPAKAFGKTCAAPVPDVQRSASTEAAAKGTWEESCVDNTAGDGSAPTPIVHTGPDASAGGDPSAKVMCASFADTAMSESMSEERSQNGGDAEGEEQRTEVQESSRCEMEDGDKAAGEAEDSSDCSCSTSSSSEDDRAFQLPSFRENLEPPAGAPTYPEAALEPLVFGDGALLDIESTRPRSVRATDDCICFVLQKEDFLVCVSRHPRERARFEQMAQEKIQEWHKCGLRRLGSVDIFSSCSPNFLAAIAHCVDPVMFFPAAVILEEGMLPEGLLLLMDGSAETRDEDSRAKTIQAPHTIGAPETLGLDCSYDARHEMVATSLCQVLTLAREDLLEVLKELPQESNSIISETLRASGVSLKRIGNRMGEEAVHKPEDARRGAITTGTGADETSDVWFMPFCKNTDPNFLQHFVVSLDRRRLMPDQCLFTETDTNHSDCADFLVVLLAGSVTVDDRSSDERPPPDSRPRSGCSTRSGGSGHSTSSRRVAPWLKKVPAPLVIVGFQRFYQERIVANQICDVHRLSVGSATKLAKEFPDDLRLVLQRLTRFQAMLDSDPDRGGEPWWRATTTLRYQPAFKECDECLLKFIWEASCTRLYLPGDVIVAEGAKADCSMLLESGTASVEKLDTRSLDAKDRICEISDGAWIGELMKFAETSKRHATIRATSICKAQRLMTRDLVALLARFPHERQRFREMAEHKLRAMESERLEEFSFFNALDRRLMTLLRPRIRTQVFFAGEVVMHQGDVADSLFVFGSDSSLLMEVDGVVVKEQLGRACLGVAALLCRSKAIQRAATVITQSVCAVRKLSRDDWLETLRHYPDHRQWIRRFTQDQLQQVREDRAQFAKKLAWDKIREREAQATLVHRARRLHLPPPPPQKQAQKCISDGEEDNPRPSSRLSYVSRSTARSSSRMQFPNISWQRGPPVPVKDISSFAHQAAEKHRAKPQADHGCPPALVTSLVPLGTDRPVSAVDNAEVGTVDKAADMQPQRPCGRPKSGSSCNVVRRQLTASASPASACVPEVAEQSPSAPKQRQELQEQERERWSCFNDRYINVPHTRLPRLGGRRVQAAGDKARRATTLKTSSSRAFSASPSAGEWLEVFSGTDSESDKEGLDDMENRGLSGETVFGYVLTDSIMYGERSAAPEP